MYTIKMPQAKPTMTKGTIFQWMKRQGDAVKKGDVFLKIESDDGLIEVASDLRGVLKKILVDKGTTVAVGTGIGELENIKEEKTESQRSVAINTEEKKMTGKVTAIVMPKAGQSMEEGTILKWRVAAGSHIKKGDVIFEIETDKATLEVEAVDEGRLAKIVAAEGGVVKVLEPVAYLADNDADVDAFTANLPGTVSTEQAAVSQIQAPPAKNMAEPVVREDSRKRASPAARKLSEERGIDINRLPPGSGPGGRILSTDVPAAMKPEQVQPPVAAGEVVRTRMSPMRKAIARNLLASKQNIPHFYIRTTIAADPLFSFYQSEKAKYPCSVNDVVVLACAKAIREFPAFRSRIDVQKDEIVTFPASNIGIAVGLEDGLVVPVLVGAEKMTLQQIAAETKRIAASARGGKIEGMGKGVFTITNLGMFGVEEFSAIINPPEAAILAVGAARESVIVSGGAMRLGKVMSLTLSADHRVIDGMLAAKFMARLKELLESPAQLV